MRAYHNACRHRGVKLVEGNGNRRTFVCPFHGWCWGIDGRNTFVLRPEEFDEHNLNPDDLRLVSVRCELWGGCAWINLDDDAPPLRDCFEPFASIYDAWKVESLRVEWWQSCRLPVNWKLATAAFMEGYHVPQTHPQLLPSSMPKPSPAAPGLIQTNLYFMRTLGEGMAGMTHENDIRIAEGLQDLELPSDPAEAMAVWRRTLNDAIVALASRPGLRHARPQRAWRNAASPRRSISLPALLCAAAVQQRLLVPDPSARSRGDTVRDLVAHPHSTGPDHGQADTAGTHGTRRPPLAADPRPGLLQSAQAAKRAALQGV